MERVPASFLGTLLSCFLPFVLDWGMFVGSWIHLWLPPPYSELAWAWPRARRVGTQQICMGNQMNASNAGHHEGLSLPQFTHQFSRQMGCRLWARPGHCGLGGIEQRSKKSVLWITSTEVDVGG